MRSILNKLKMPARMALRGAAFLTALVLLGGCGNRENPAGTGTEVPAIGSSEIISPTAHMPQEGSSAAEKDPESSADPAAETGRESAAETTAWEQPAVARLKAMAPEVMPTLTDAGEGCVPYAGFSLFHDGWSLIALDVSRDYLTSNVCHEVWHALEYRMQDIHPEFFYPNDWAELNPPGFSYINDMADYGETPERWTLYSAGGEDVYFVDSYGKQNEHEDRARIMEYVMTRPEWAETLVSSPHIAAKLGQMSRALRICFDSEDWGEVIWERYLP